METRICDYCDTEFTGSTCTECGYDFTGVYPDLDASDAE